MADLTPELLAQLEQDIAAMAQHRRATEAAMSKLTLTVQPWLAEHIRRALNAVPALLAAVKAACDDAAAAAACDAELDLARRLDEVAS